MLTGEAFLSSYRARVPDEQWEVIEPIVKNLVRKAGYTDRPYAREAVKALTHLAVWARRHGISLETETLLSPATVERYVATGTPTLSPATRGTRRSTLTVLARRLTRTAPWAPERSRYPHAKPLRPYETAQIPHLLSIANHQSTLSKVRAATAIIGLGLGAGLRPFEVRIAQGADIDRNEHGNIVVNVGGRFPRTVPVLEPLTDSVAELAQRHSGLLIRNAAIPRPHVLADIVRKLDVPEALAPLSISRLRTTWAVVAVTSVPLPIAAAAYGAPTLRFLLPLAPHITPNLAWPASQMGPLAAVRLD